ncbi:MAG: helix-turn-helix domain-containing protein [Clostridia bacterium]|nr:helix-turn-helix domain-containing protein [Clostridia bacterium]
MALYPNLEAEMTRNGVTQKDIASLLGKTPETICNWMNGRSGDFPVGAVMQVKREFFPNQSIEYLFAEVPMAG